MVDSNIAYDKYGTCSWKTGLNGVLTIYPDSSGNGVLRPGCDGWAWHNAAEVVTGVVVKEGVHCTDCSRMFADMTRCTSMDLSGLDTSGATNMSGMFESCLSLTSLDVSGFDTRSVTNMSSMFSYCWSLKTLNLASFDTGNVTDMSFMLRPVNPPPSRPRHSRCRSG